MQWSLAAEIAMVTDLFIYDHMVPAAGSDQLSDTDVSDRYFSILVISVPQYTITLPGIAGLILSVRYGGRCEYYYQ